MPVPKGEYHWHMIPMEQAFSLHRALAEDKNISLDFLTVHPDKYKESDPIKNKYRKDDYQAITGFHFKVINMSSNSEAVEYVFKIIKDRLGNNHKLGVALFRSDSLQRENLMIDGVRFVNSNNRFKRKNNFNPF